MKDRAIVTKKWQQEIICAQRNRNISDDLEWPLKVISTTYLLLLNVCTQLTYNLLVTA